MCERIHYCVRGAVCGGGVCHCSVRLRVGAWVGALEWVRGGLRRGDVSRI